MKKYLIASLFGLIMCMAYTQKSQAATQAYGTNLTLAIGGAPASFNFTSPANDSFQKSAGTILSSGMPKASFFMTTPIPLLIRMAPT